MPPSDRRRTVCKKWIVVEGVRTPCSFMRGHAGDCSWAMNLTGLDGVAHRDLGPFRDAAQALAQYAAWSTNLPVPGEQGALMSLQEGALMAGIVPTQFETEYLAAHGLDPIAATILSSWLFRACLTGRPVVRPVPPGDV